MPDKRILIDVQGGLVQEVFVTPGLDAKVFRVDWDGIKEGDIDDPPWVEWDPVELSADEFDARLKEAEAEHADRRQCHHCGAPLTDHDENTCPKKLWKDNDLQFPRLLAALRVLGVSESRKLLLASKLGVSEEEIDKLLERANDVFEHNKDKFGLDLTDQGY